MNTLFDSSPLPTGPMTRPAAPTAQADGLAHARAELYGVRSLVAAILHKAGPARKHGGTVTGGATIQELAAEVSKRRDKLTKEISITQPLKDLRGQGLVRDSGLTRMGDAGVSVTVWEHTGGNGGAS